MKKYLNVNLDDYMEQNSINCKTLDELVHSMKGRMVHLEKKCNDLEKINNELIIENKKFKESNEMLRKKYDTFVNSKTGALAYRIYSNKNINKTLLKFKQKVYSMLVILKRSVLNIKNKKKFLL